ncbi:MAG: DUF6069 family protein [Anaerolineales bacterium]|nr:DUF6069 family protein [Anaerolineales bacterium]MDW8162846.1 DUF6069 family protein [Anaerolineales bacterium]
MAEQQRLSNSSVLRAGAIAVVVAVLANILARFLLGLVVPLTPDFQPFSYGAIVFFTVLFTVAGVVVFWVVSRFVSNPLRVYNIVGVVAFFLSLAPNLAGAANPSAMPMGGKGSDYLLLILFHIVAAVAFLGTLNRLSRAQGA